MTLPTLNEVSKIQPTFTPPGSVWRATALRAADAMHPQLAQSGLPPNWQGVIFVWRSAERHSVVLAKTQSAGESGGCTIDVEQPLRHLDLGEALAQHQQLAHDPFAVFGTEPFLRLFPNLRSVEAHPDGPDARVVGPLLDERFDVAVTLHLLTGDRAVHGDPVSLNVLQDAIVGGRRPPHVVLRLQAVDGDADLKVLDAGPGFGNRAHRAGDELAVDAHVGQPRQQHVQLAEADQGLAADDRQVDGPVLGDNLEHAVDEGLALEIGKRPQRLPAAQVLVAVGVAPRTAERTLTSNFDGKVWTVTLENAAPGRNNAFHHVTLAHSPYLAATNMISTRPSALTSPVPTVARVG